MGAQARTGDCYPSGQREHCRETMTSTPQPSLYDSILTMDGQGHMI